MKERRGGERRGAERRAGERRAGGRRAIDGGASEAVVLRVRMGAGDAHYGGNLIDGARILGLFGDVATELLIRSDGDEGLFAAYESVEFLAPVYAGDFIEAEGRIVRFGNRSRTIEFEARKVIAARPERTPSSADVLTQPVVVCRARGICVAPAHSPAPPADADR